jgi:hypothetical protein
MVLAFSLRLDFVDAKGKTSFTKMRIPTGFTLANYTQFAQAAAQLYSDNSECSVTSAGISFDVDLSGLGLDTVASDVTRIARKLWLRFTTAVSGFLAQTKIPGLRETQMVAGSKNIDQTDTDVAALVSAFEDGIAVTGGTVTFSNDREQDAVSLRSGTENFLA